MKSTSSSNKLPSSNLYNAIAVIQIRVYLASTMQRKSIHKQKPTTSLYFSYIIHSYVSSDCRYITVHCIGHCCVDQGNQTDYFIDALLHGATMRIFIGLRAWVLEGQQPKGCIIHQLLPTQLSKHQWRQLRIKIIRLVEDLLFTTSTHHQVRNNNSWIDFSNWPSL